MPDLRCDDADSRFIPFSVSFFMLPVPFMLGPVPIGKIHIPNSTCKDYRTPLSSIKSREWKVKLEIKKWQ